ncbi:hypothetical protein BRADO1940 [Bradyrhizobium sp. ORS 278]|uniref:hypothetical protein n=1 Tax=Bradyrhizobium sp. (strain ORS 278) TaxID=114615 RepID=UPI0001507E60|nr:hypothetical protein [Bradyrhizobium sp. ORS 278]CAL75803.1 hypothetical protein BRADO1940 [Bradyrhizobium sp. ORS 278]
MFHFSNLVRSKGDPKIISTGPSSLTSADRLARGLGWFSIALGTLELLAPHRVTNALGMQGREGLVRAYGVRELLAGVMTLSVEKRAGLWSRVAGDGLDMVTLLGEVRPSNPRAGTVMAALVMVGGITMLDYIAAKDVAAQHDPKRGRKRLYSDRSGYPKGIAAVRGAALAPPAKSPVTT